MYCYLVLVSVLKMPVLVSVLVLTLLVLALVSVSELLVLTTRLAVSHNDIKQGFSCKQLDSVVTLLALPLKSPQCSSFIFICQTALFCRAANIIRSISDSN